MIQGILDNIKSLKRKYLISMSRFQSGANIEMSLQVSQKCFYCFETDHLFLFCSVKTEDKKRRYILVDKFTVWFVNGEPILLNQNLLIKECIRKHILALIAVIM